jgi:hypothetical protein
MKNTSCCISPDWQSDLKDMGHFDSFEFMLGRCKNCGTWWMDIFCVAANTSGCERVSDNDAHVMLSTSSGPELKAFMKGWFKAH